MSGSKFTPRRKEMIMDTRYVRPWCKTPESGIEPKCHGGKKCKHKK